MKQFWMVWHVGGRSPNFRHEDEQSAETEAKRLAMQNPGEEFTVLEAISVHKRTDIHSMDLRGVRDEIPF